MQTDFIYDCTQSFVYSWVPSASRYTGKERDQESGLDYFPTRYYGSTMGRWSSPDSYGGVLANPQSLNRYAYVGNNPLRYIDPLGLCEEDPQATEHCSIDVRLDVETGKESAGPLVCDCGVGPSNDAAALAGLAPQSAGGSAPAGGGNNGDSFDPGSLGANLFSPSIGGAYFGGANSVVKGATIGYVALAGSAVAAPAAVSATLTYGAQLIGASQATALGTTGIVLGAYEEGGGYLEAAAQNGMNAFNFPNLYPGLEATGNAWTANQAFIDAGIRSGQNFYLSSAPYVTGGLGYASEMLYLSGRGITAAPLASIPH